MVTRTPVCLRSAARRLRGWASILLAALAGSGSLHAEISREYQLKAAFLFNFTKFVEWPARRFADERSPILIGVVGENPIGAALADLVTGRLVNGRPIAVAYPKNTGEMQRVHLLFVARGEEDRLTELQSSGTTVVLTVGESDRFAELGGMINFVVADEKVRFEVNLATAEKHGIKISAQLVKLAARVRR